MAKTDYSFGNMDCKFVGIKSFDSENCIASASMHVASCSETLIVDCSVKDML